MAIVSPKQKLHIKAPGEVITAGEYKTILSKEFEVEESIIGKILTAVFSGEEPDFDELKSKKVRMAAKSAFKQIKKDISSHKKNKASYEKQVEADKEAAREAREREKEEREDRRRKYAIVFRKAQERAETAIVQKTATKVDNDLATIIGNKFVIKDDQIEIKKGEKPTLDDFTNAFAAFASGNKLTESLNDSLGKREAQMFRLALATVGEQAYDVYSDNPKAIERIKRNLAILNAVDELGKLGKEFLKVFPLSSARRLLIRPATVDTAGSIEKATEENIKHRKVLFEQVLEKYKESGTLVPQNEINNIVAAYKRKLGFKAKERFKFIAFFVDDEGVHVYGVNNRTPGLMSIATLVIDTAQNIFVLSEDGKSEIKDELESIPEDLLEEIQENEPKKEAKKKAAKKSAKKAKKKVVEEEEEDEEVEEEEEEEVEEADDEEAEEQDNEEEEDNEEEDDDESDDEDEDESDDDEEEDDDESDEDDDEEEDDDEDDEDEDEDDE